jgi:Thioredoxin like C-terminal domain
MPRSCIHPPFWPNHSTVCVACRGGRDRASREGLLRRYARSPGADGGNGTIVEQRLYQLIRQPSPIVDRTFEIAFLDSGVETFAFTFG